MTDLSGLQQQLGALTAQVGIAQQQVVAAGAQAIIAQQAMLPIHLWETEFLEWWVRQPSANGGTSLTLGVGLHRNALVRRLDVVVGATRSEAVLLGRAAQVRQQSGGSGTLTVVADFGTLVTVGSVGALPSSKFRVRSVTPWTGLAFGRPLTPTNAHAAMTGDMVVMSFDELRTERLQIVLAGSGALTDVLETVWAELPDPPSDLAIRVGAGPVVWSSPGPVRPGQGGWSAEGTQTVALGPALAALTGDPDDDSPVTFELTLTSRTPGRLSLAEAADGRDLRYLARVRPGGGDAADVAFESEGSRNLTLPLPGWVGKVERVVFTATAALGPERAVPPVGPPIAASLGTGSTAHPGGVAELVLDPDRSACARLPDAPGIAEATALRLPLRAGPAGAEVRVVLLAADENGKPGEPMDGAVSRPVTLDPPAPAATPAYGWCTFELPAPVPLAAGAPAPWAAVQVARGEAAWPLGDVKRPPEVDPEVPIRRGPPTGPWQELPRLVQRIPGVGARLRVVGHAAKEAPLAPLVVQVQGAAALPAFDADGRAVRVTPTPRGAQVEWTASPALAPRAAAAAKSLELVVTSHVAGTVTLRDVVVTATRSKT